MSYSIYTTKAIVLSVRNVGEANRMYMLLTRDVGTISATAQSVRLEKSKLRHALQTLSVSEVSLVRGKAGWRITNAYSFGNIFFETEKNKQDLAVRISSLLRRLLAGETPDPELFEVVWGGFNTLLTIPGEDIDSFELIFVVKILAALGYGTDSKDLGFFKSESFSNIGMYHFAKEKRSHLVKEINTTLRATGL